MPGNDTRNIAWSLHCPRSAVAAGLVSPRSAVGKRPGPFGYRTAWVNWLAVPFEQLGPGPAFVSPTMSAMLDLAAVT